MINQDFKALGKEISNLAPSLTGTAVGLATVKGMQSVGGSPSTKLFAGTISGGLTTATIMGIQYLSKILSKDHFKDDLNKK